MIVKTILDGGDSNIHQDKTFSIIYKTLSSEGYTEGDISIIFTGDESLRRLKKEFFKKDEFTDVIAFRLNDYSEKKLEGEIYISLERAKENAANFNEPVEKEICRLLIHGGLHLLNFDDKTEDERKIMREKENYYLTQFGWKGIINE